MDNKIEEKRFELRLSKELYDKLKTLANNNNLTMTAMIKIILLNYLNRKETDK